MRTSSRFNRIVCLLLSAALLSSTVCPPPVLGSLQDRALRDGTSAAPSAGVPVEAPHFFDPAQLNVPERLGHIVETFAPDSKPETRNSKLIIHLQDLHTQYEAQRALADLIHELRRSTGVSLVALEGGAGPGDTEFFSDFPDQDTNQQLADFFLKKGLFTGPVAYAVTHPGQVSLYGVEDPVAYLDHLKSYQAGQPRQQQATQHLKTLVAVLQELQDQLNTNALKAFVAKAKEYEEETISFSAYLRDLRHRAGRAHMSLEAYPNLSRFVRLLNPQTESLRLSKELQPHRLAAELDQLAAAIKERLFTTPDQRHLDQLLFVVGVLKELYNAQLSPDRFDYYHTHQAAFSARPFIVFLNAHQRLTPALRHAITSLFEDLSVQARFYEIAHKRDDALVTNTLRQMDEQQQSVAILVAGGFHTHGLTRLLKDRGVAYVVISPTVEGQMDDALYTSLLLNQVPSIGQLIKEFFAEATKGSPGGAQSGTDRRNETVLHAPNGFLTSLDSQVELTQQPTVGRDNEETPEKHQSANTTKKPGKSPRLWLSGY